jgi:fucose permease
VPRASGGGPARRVSSRVRAQATRIFSGILVLVGLALLIETAALGGGIGLLLGALFVLAGGLRLYLSFR